MQNLGDNKKLADLKSTGIQLDNSIERFLFLYAFQFYHIFSHGGLIYRLAGISSFRIIFPSPQNGQVVRSSPVTMR